MLIAPFAAKVRGELFAGGYQQNGAERGAYGIYFGKRKIGARKEFVKAFPAAVPAVPAQIPRAFRTNAFRAAQARAFAVYLLYKIVVFAKDGEFRSGTRTLYVFAYAVERGREPFVDVHAQKCLRKRIRDYYLRENGKYTR
jgi:alkylhydroperoxidase/carboxymuconolactone decarboxylase family protein YurZ